MSAAEFDTWQCSLCGFIYEQSAGLPGDGIAPSTHWADVPDSFVCPACSGGKDDFEKVEI